jgi:chromatin remodeling complex protein RSC6
MAETEQALVAISNQFNNINDSLSLFKMQLSTLQQQLRNVEKNVRKELKKIKKESKSDITKTKRAPSGFAKPTKVTKELCVFMERPEGTEIARTEVTKTLVSYIKKHNLLEQGESAKNRIVPDEKLKSLLGLSEAEIPELNYFTIQKYMNKHFYSKKPEPNTESLEL